MSLRTRLLLAFAAIAFLPVALLSLGVRREMNERLSSQYQGRLDAVRQVIEQDLRREAAAIDDRLGAIRVALLKDSRFRLGSVAGVGAERAYVLDYAENTMRTAGLSMLQIYDQDGRIVSSGHFRNEHGRADPKLLEGLAQEDGGIVLTRARAAEEDFLALVRTSSLRLGDRTFTLAGGVAVDASLLRRLARDEVDLSLRFPGGALTSGSGGSDESAPPIGLVREEISIPMIVPAASTVDRAAAVLQISQSRAPLAALLRQVDRWVAGVTLVTGAAALLLAVWISSRISRPIAALAGRAAAMDIDRLDVRFDDATGEVGTLSRVLGDLAERLRAGTARIREAERRATMGDLARQINHDIKNGLIPIRNVMRHVTQVARDDPAALAVVLAERRQTLDSSIAYLETLATNYERLSARPSVGACDLNALILDVVRGVRGHEHVDLQTSLSPAGPRVRADPIALRRILENLTSNAIDSLERRPGRVTISTARIATDGRPDLVRLTVADTGRGMRPEESAKIFNDFYTTKERGTGLGLSIVRRLVMDMQGSLRVESEPGAGTRMIVDVPAAAVEP